MKRADFVVLSTVLMCHAAGGLMPSLWLDEAGTWWIVKDGLDDSYARALSWSASAPLYYVTLWCITQLAGLSEATLRVPSMLWGAATAIVVFRLGRRWFDAEGAMLVVLFFLYFPAVQFAVVDARPYAMGLFLLALSWLLVVRATETQSVGDAVAATMCMAAVVWVHYTFALGLVPLCCFWPRLGWRRVLAMSCGVTMLLVPVLWQVLDTVSRRSTLSWARPPTLFELAVGLGLTVLPTLFLLRSANAKASMREIRSLAEQSLFPFMALALLPPITFFVLSRLDLVHLFVPRYVLSKELGLAFLAAALARGITAPTLRRVGVVLHLLFLLALSRPYSFNHGDEDWRGASQWANTLLEEDSRTTVVLMSGFIESVRPGILENAAFREILFAPQTVYPVRTEPVLMPWRPTVDTAARIRDLVVRRAAEAGRVAVVSLAPSADYDALLTEGLGSRGLQRVEVREFGQVRGQLFVRLP